MSTICSIMGLFWHMIHLSLSTRIISSGGQVTTRTVCRVIPIISTPIRIIRGPTRVNRTGNYTLLRRHVYSTTHGGALTNSRLTPRRRTSIFALGIPPLYSMIPNVSRLQIPSVIIPGVPTLR